MKTSQAPVWSARTLAEAITLRAEHPRATVVAGGTDVMVYLEAGTLDPVEVIDLWGCQDLRFVEAGAGPAGARALRIGALTTWTDLVRHPDALPVLRECARTIGAQQIQNRGTVGGNIVNASPAGDSLPVWLALDATFEVAGPRGRRVVPAGDFFTGYRQVDLRPDELLVAVNVPAAVSRGGVPDRLYYRKVGTRLAQAISKVVLAGRLRIEDGVVTEARVAMGSVAAVPVRLPSVEAALVGLPPDPTAADAVVADITPIDDVRSTAEYRLAVATRAVRTWLADVAAGAGR